jgi:hypothetical protein
MVAASTLRLSLNGNEEIAVALAKASFAGGVAPAAGTNERRTLATVKSTAKRAHVVDISHLLSDELGGAR